VEFLMYLTYFGSYCMFIMALPILESRQRFLEVLQKSLSEFTHLYVRIITIPHSIHITTQNHDKIPVQQYIGKNVGIRRALGEYVLASNADIIFSKPFLKFIKSKSLQQGLYYRTNLMMTANPIPFPLLSSYWESYLRLDTDFVKFPGVILPITLKPEHTEEFWIWYDIKSRQGYWETIEKKEIKTMAGLPPDSSGGLPPHAFLSMEIPPWPSTTGSNESRRPSNHDHVCHALFGGDYSSP